MSKAIKDLDAAEQAAFAFHEKLKDLILEHPDFGRNLDITFGVASALSLDGIMTIAVLLKDEAKIRSYFNDMITDVMKKKDEVDDELQKRTAEARGTFSS